jgi:threonine synthase
MEHVLGLKCILCGREFSVDEQDYVCPDHGAEGILDVRYDYPRIGRSFSPKTLATSTDFSQWRYRPLLPIRPDSPLPPLAVGWTPLYRAPRLAADLGLEHLWVKDDGRQPTASLKDRASAIALIKAREKGASVGQANVIFVPESAPEAKIAQLLAFGATVLLVRGSYDDAFDLCLWAEGEYGWYNRNTGYNPYMSEGKKTASLEICEQLGWQAPDRIFVSVGDGCIIGGLHKGLKDLAALGWIDRMPKLMGIQAEGSGFLVQAWEAGEDVLTKAPIAAHTVADSISAGLPRDRVKAMAAVRETGGAFLSVSDAEILAAIPALARGCGVFAEPAGAASYAGLVKACAAGMVAAGERVVVLNTGSGLKDVASALRAVRQAGRQAVTVEPDLEDLKRVVAKMNPIPAR